MTGFSQPERRGLERLQRAQTAQTHPDADLLNAFSEQTLTVREREQILTHLAVCPTCREVISLAAPQAVEELVLPAKSKPASWKWPVLRWGTVAASAAIILVAVSLRKDEKPSSMAQITTDSAPMSAPAAKQEAASEKAALDKAKSSNAVQNNAVLDEVSAVPATAGVKAPEIRYEKVAPQAKKDAEAPSAMLAKENNAPAAGMATGGLVNNASRADLASATPNAPMKAGESSTRDAKALANETEAKRRAVAPPPPTVATDKTAGARISSTETVEVAADHATVAAEVAPVQSSAASSPVANSMHGSAMKAQVAPQVESQTAQANAVSRDRAYNSLDTKWQVTPDGYLLNSTDQGKNWARQLPDQRFTHVQTVGNHVWACGATGALMHSIDGGTSWTTVVPTDKDAKPQGEITSIVFLDVNHGTLKTSTNETWSTSDAGKSWKKK